MNKNSRGVGKEVIVSTFRETPSDARDTIIESIRTRLAELGQNFRINRSLSAEEKEEFARLSQRLREWES